MFSSQGQAQVFLATVYAGLAAGVAYDMLRLLRLSTKASVLLTALLDLLFWVVTAALVAIAAALSGADGLRFYLLLGTASGMLLWAAGLRRIIASTGRWVQRILSGNKEGLREGNREIPASKEATANKSAGAKRRRDDIGKNRVHAP